MKKETFQKKWYYRLIQIIFWGSLIFLSGALIILGLYEDDIPAAGFFWAGVVVLAYWIAKRIFYHIIFGDRILPRK
jgi:hypothetical protein